MFRYCGKAMNPVIPVNDCTSGIMIMDQRTGTRYLVWDRDVDRFTRKGGPDYLVVGWAEEEKATFWLRCRCWLRTRKWLPSGCRFLDVLGSGHV